MIECFISFFFFYFYNSSVFETFEILYEPCSIIISSKDSV